MLAASSLARPAASDDSPPSPRHAQPAQPAPSAPATAGGSSSLTLPANPNDSPRPSRVQFMPNRKTGIPSGSPKPSTKLRLRKMSPPPPPLFQPRVSFDTFHRQADTKHDTTSFSLIKKHKDFEYSKRSRTFLCGLDANKYSEFALEWLIDELVDDGDEIVCLRVVEKDSLIAGPSSVEQGRYRAEAETLMKQIQEKNVNNKAINLVLEFSVGKVQEVIDDMIKIHEPAILIVGTRGRSLGGFQGLLPGSVSKWVLQHSPVPVIVVRPNSKRAKNKRKRQQDPTRTGYRDLLDKSNPQGGGHLLHSRSRPDVALSSQTAPNAEATAVAAAIGVTGELSSLGPKEESLTKVESIRTDASTRSPESMASVRDESSEATRSPSRVMQSPGELKLDSPDLSAVESEDESGGDEESPDLKAQDASVDDAAKAVGTVSIEESVAALKDSEIASETARRA